MALGAYLHRQCTPRHARLCACRRREDVGVNTTYGDSAYIFEMSPRPDVDHRGRSLAKQGDDEDWHAHEGR